MNFADYGLYFRLTLVLSTLFAMGGVGAAIALVPSFLMLGLAIDFVKAPGLFVNTASTMTASVMNFRRGVLDIGFALPLVLSGPGRDPDRRLFQPLRADRGDPMAADRLPGRRGVPPAVLSASAEEPY